MMWFVLESNIKHSNTSEFSSFDPLVGLNKYMPNCLQANHLI